MWFIWKARNDKLFRRIDRNPLETVRHAESKCHASFQANNKQEEHVIAHNLGQLTNSEKCMIDGLWTHDAHYSGYGWTWKTSWGTTRLLGARNQQWRISPLHSELEAFLWVMECMLQLLTSQVFGTDCKDLILMIQDPGAWPNFSTELAELQKLKSRFPEFSIIFIPRSKNVPSDSLANITRSFHRNLYYIDFSIPVWFCRPPQAWVIYQPFDVKKKTRKTKLHTTF